MCILVSMTKTFNRLDMGYMTVLTHVSVYRRLNRVKEDNGLSSLNKAIEMLLDRHEGKRGSGCKCR